MKGVYTPIYKQQKFKELENLQMKRIYFFLMAMVICVAMVACGGQNEGSAEQTAPAPTATTEMMDAKPTKEEMAKEEPTAESMAEKPTAEAMMEDDSDDTMTTEEPTAEAMMDDDSKMDDDSDHTMMTEEPTSEAMMDDDSEDTMVAEDDQMINRPAWQTISLVNAQTGESFTLADFAGKTIYIEPMATWCGNCRQQLGNVQAAKDQLNRDDIVFVGLSVETTISKEELAEYAQSQGFNFVWAVLTPESLQAFVAQFGQTFANPPSTPHVIIQSDGSFGELKTGIESAEQLIQQLNAN